MTSITRTSFQSTNRRTSGLREFSPEQKAPELEIAVNAPTDLAVGDSLSLEARFTQAEPRANITWSVNGEVRRRPLNKPIIGACLAVKSKTFFKHYVAHLFANSTTLCTYSSIL